MEFPEINMQALHVAFLLMEPAGCTVNKAGIIQLLEPVIGIIRAKLSPALVEDRP